MTLLTVFQEGGMTSSTVAVEASDEAASVRVPSTVGVAGETAIKVVGKGVGDATTAGTTIPIIL
jgi:hypothetical protein